jgi:DNA topoisomerase-1
MAYTLILTEKPTAAQKIAYALAEGEVKKINKNGVSYYKIKRGNKNFVVVPAVGHLFVLSEKNAGYTWTYPTFFTEWKPTFLNKGNLWAKKYYQNIKDLAKNADEFISATDYDREGSVIAYNILRFICNVNDAKRMKFSTLTKPDLIEAYEKASEHLDFSQIEAGLTRHILDWQWGINLSRALTLALRDAGGYKTISAGRVQGPTLKILEKREREIEQFKPEPYWEIELEGLLNGNKIVAYHIEGKFWEKNKALEVLKKCEGQEAFVDKVERREYKQNPPPPFDLTTLQRESYKNFGLSPKQTLDIAQNLYLKALISYPRTSSQKLPPKIGYKKILQKLSGQKEYAELCDKLLRKPKLYPIQGKKTDPAHPAIYPTGNRPVGLTSQQKRVYDLIVKRFLSVFAEPAIRETVKINILISSETFLAEGVRTIEHNWMDFYKPYSKFKEVILPLAKKGDKIDVKQIKLLNKETQPPKRFTQATILKEMESLSLGTKATRAQILQTLYDRGYIREKAIVVTDLGKSVISALDKYCPEIISVQLTRQFEKEMEDIENNKKRREDVIKESEITLRKILEKFKNNQKSIGAELLKGIKKLIKEETTVGKCKCGGDLEIKQLRNGKRFIGCSNYPRCTETFSLPGQGKLTILKTKCDKCGLHIISVKQFRKRPWKFCVRCGFVSKTKKK